MSDVTNRMKAVLGVTDKPGPIVPVQVVGRVVGASTPPPKPSSSSAQLLKQLRHLASRLPDA